MLTPLASRTCFCFLPFESSEYQIVGLPVYSSCFSIQIITVRAKGCIFISSSLFL